MKISKYEVEMMEAVHAGKVSRKYACAMLFLTMNQLQHRMRDLRLVRDRSPILSEHDDELCYELRKGIDGLSYRAIGDKFEISAYAAMKAVERHKTKLLTHGFTLESLA